MPDNTCVGGKGKEEEETGKKKLNRSDILDSSKRNKKQQVKKKNNNEVRVEEEEATIFVRDRRWDRLLNAAGAGLTWPNLSITNRNTSEVLSHLGEWVMSVATNALF